MIIHLPDGSSVEIRSAGDTYKLLAIVDGIRIEITTPFAQLMEAVKQFGEAAADAVEDLVMLAKECCVEPMDVGPWPSLRNDFRGRIMRRLMQCWPYPSGFT